MLTYQKAVTGSDKDKWERVILEEKESLIENNTWKEVDILSEAMNKKIVKNK